MPFGNKEQFHATSNPEQHFDEMSKALLYLELASGK